MLSIEGFESRYLRFHRILRGAAQVPELPQHGRPELSDSFFRSNLKRPVRFFVLLQFPRNHLTKSLHFLKYPLFRIALQ